MNLGQQIKVLFDLYGRRNAIHFRGETRFLALHDSVRMLNKLLRKGETDKEVLGKMLAAVFAWTCAIADSFIDLELVRELCNKYPHFGCAYCRQKKCMCSEDRQFQYKEYQSLHPQREWTISEWCAHLDEVYGANNRARGLGQCLLRLYEEISEAEITVLTHVHHADKSVDDLRKYTAREFADVFAWIFSLAALLEVDLQLSVENAYNAGCRRCERRVWCNCPNPAMISARVSVGSRFGE